jgi:hypothetical protein
MTEISNEQREDVGKANILDKLRENWPSPSVKRKDIGKFSCGIINKNTIASLDSVGNGIKNRFRIGHEIAYSVESVIEWLKTRMEVKQC